MTYRMAPMSVTSNDLKVHSVVAGLFKCNLSNICTVFYISTNSVLARSLRVSWASSFQRWGQARKGPKPKHWWDCVLDLTNLFPLSPQIDSIWAMMFICWTFSGTPCTVSRPDWADTQGCKVGLLKLTTLSKQFDTFSLSHEFILLTIWVWSSSMLERDFYSRMPVSHTC